LSHPFLGYVRTVGTILHVASKKFKDKMKKVSKPVLLLRKTAVKSFNFMFYSI